MSISYNAGFRFSILGAALLACSSTTVDPSLNPGTVQPVVDSGPDPYATPTQCSSGKNWTGGSRGSTLMKPGDQCVSCHKANKGPTLSIGGTVYPTAHEPLNCNGIVDIDVVVTDANGKSVTLTTNLAGNFYSSTKLTPPLTAKVVSGDKERVMKQAIDSGDCNTCHTEQGASSAPGRIMAP